MNSSLLIYNEEDRLKTCMGQTYTYNGFDTRVGKNGTTYHRDGTGVTAPLISDSNATYTPGISERRNGVSTFLNSGLKDVAKQTDISGNVTATRKYDAYGMVIGSTGTWKGPFGYSGSAGYQEDETGLQLLGHRYYDSSTGRFITRDPIKDGRNWYGYCDNNPVNAIDADGLQKRALTSDEKEEVQRQINQLKWRGEKGAATDLQKMLDEGRIMVDTDLKGGATKAYNSESAFSSAIYLSPDLFGNLDSARKGKSDYNRAEAWFEFQAILYHEWFHTKQGTGWKKFHPNQMEEDAWRAQRKFLERLLKQTNLSPIMREAIEQLIDRAKDEENLHGGRGGG